MFHGAGSRICPNVAGPLGITAKPSWASKLLGDEPSPGQWVRAPINCGLALWAGMAYGHGERSQLQKKNAITFPKKQNGNATAFARFCFFFFFKYTPRTHHVFFKQSFCTKRSHNTSTRTLPTPRLWMCTAQHSKGQARTDDTPRRLVRGCLEARASAVRIPLDLRFCAFTVHT